MVLHGVFYANHRGFAILLRLAMMNIFTRDEVIALPLTEKERQRQRNDNNGDDSDHPSIRDDDDDDEDDGSSDDDDPFTVEMWMEGDSLAPPCGSAVPVVHAMLEFEGLKRGVDSDDVLYDLGCGDGRVCLEVWR